MTLARLVALVSTVVVLVSSSLSRGGEPPKGGEVFQNGDFAEADADQAPKGWFVPTPGFSAKVVTDEAAPGKKAAQIEPSKGEAGAKAPPFGNLMQSFDATPFRGKRIVVRAEVRLAGAGGKADANARAQMWVRVDRPGEKMGFFDNMGNRPIRGESARTYQAYTISGMVEDDAVGINVGLMVFGGATARIANVTVSAGEAGESGDRAAAPLSERGVANLTAFAKLYGYVRFFHPSDQGSGVKWDEFAIAAVEHVEPAANAEELAKALQDVFGPIAPTVQVWVGDVAAAPPELAKPEGAKKFVVWKHFGCGLSEGPNNLYWSRRERSMIEAPDEGLPAPGTSVVKVLGGGVSCRVAVAVYADEEGKTLPRAMGETVPLKAVGGRPEYWAPSGKDRSTRLGDVVSAWNVFQHFYPYFDVVNTDWAATLDRSLKQAATDADDSAFVRTMQRLVADLHDGHGGVYCAAAARPSWPDMMLDWADDGASNRVLVVTAVGSGTTSVKRGDVIVEIAGRPTEEVYQESLAYISAATGQWAQHRFATDPVWIAPGSGEAAEYKVKRGAEVLSVSVPRVKGMAEAPPREKHPANGAELAPGIVYFDLNGAQTEAMDAVMDKLQNASGIVFDARGYPGSAGSTCLQHLTDKNIKSARWNVPNVTLPDRDPAGFIVKPTGRWDLPPLTPRLGAEGQKIAFVTGGGAISYAESCMAIVEYYKLGEIVGGPTAGTNGNVNPFTLPGGYNFYWTGMQVLKHDKTSHHGVGVLPTVPVKRTVAGIAAGKDEVLEAAVKRVSE